MSASGILRVWLGFALLTTVAVPLPVLPAEGVFQGTVVKPSNEDPLPPGWIFVQAKHLLRRVEVAHAVVVFQGPSGQVRRCGSGCLAVGQEIRVTASQDSAGEWRAKRVEILRLADTQCCQQAKRGLADAIEGVCVRRLNQT